MIRNHSKVFLLKAWFATKHIKIVTANGWALMKYKKLTKKIRYGLIEIGWRAEICICSWRFGARYPSFWHVFRVAKRKKNSKQFYPFSTGHPARQDDLWRRNKTVLGLIFGFPTRKKCQKADSILSRLGVGTLLRSHLRLWFFNIFRRRFFVWPT